MTVQKLGDPLYMIDLEPSGMKGVIASYVLVGEEVAIVEAGPKSTVNRLLEGLEEIGVGFGEVRYIALTHIHVDHAGGAGALIRHLPNARVVVHPRGCRNLEDPTKLWTQTRRVLRSVADLYGRPDPVPRGRMVVGVDGVTLNLGGLNLRVLETPGHASHHLSFHEDLHGGVFAGDAAGAVSYTHLTLPTTERV